MKIFFLWLIAVLTILIAFVVFVAVATADEVKCIYRPSPSDSVHYRCPDMTGKLTVTLYLCGEPYSFVAVCPTGVMENKK
jgi:hypothetical protein